MDELQLLERVGGYNDRAHRVLDAPEQLLACAAPLLAAHAVCEPLHWRRRDGRSDVHGDLGGSEGMTFEVGETDL